MYPLGTLSVRITDSLSIAEKLNVLDFPTLSYSINATNSFALDFYSCKLFCYPNKCVVFVPLAEMFFWAHVSHFDGYII